MRRTLGHDGLVVVVLAALTACAGSVPEPASAPVPDPEIAAVIASHDSVARAPDLGHAVGDSTAYGGELRWNNDKHTEAAFTIVSRAHVMLLEVTPSTGRIWPIYPDLTTPLVMRDIGTHTASMRGSGGLTLDRNTVGSSGPADPRESYAYERCMDRAAATRAKPQPAQSPPQVDKDGKPVAPPKVMATTIDGASNTPNNCRAPSTRPSAASRGPSYSSGGGAPRYLVFLASEIPIKATDLLTLKFTEGDMSSIVFSMAKKLYDRAPWSGYYVRW